MKQAKFDAQIPVSQNVGIASNSPLFVRQKEASAITGIPEATLEKDRYHGGGIPFSKKGRSVFYKVSDIIDFMDSRRVTSEDSRP